MSHIVPVSLTLKRGSTLPKVRRSDIQSGQCFSVRKRSGSVGSKVYAAIGQNGRLLSVNLKTGALAGTSNPDRLVFVMGGYNYVVTLFPTSKWTQKRRDTLKPGDVFTVDNGKHSCQYGALGKLTGGKLVSINFRSRDYASTFKGTSYCQVVGNFSMDANVIA